MQSKVPICSYIRDSGERCKAIALKDKDLCYQHNLFFKRRERIQKRMRERIEAHEKGEHMDAEAQFAKLYAELNLPPIEEPGAVPVILSALFNMIATQQADPRITGQMLHAVSMFVNVEKQRLSREYMHARDRMELLKLTAQLKQSGISLPTSAAPANAAASPEGTRDGRPA